MTFMEDFKREVDEEARELEKLKNNPTKRELYNIKSKILKDKVSALSMAEEKGRKEAKLEIDKNISLF